MTDKATYPVLSPLKHGGKRHAPGDSVELDAEAAADLQRLGIVGAASTEADPGELDPASGKAEDDQAEPAAEGPPPAEAPADEPVDEPAEAAAVAPKKRK